MQPASQPQSGPSGTTAPLRLARFVSCSGGAAVANY